ncbi:hypothetical protein K7X08_000612 [Anisodus acutangulus]|uniref:AAA ATPase AAA+ lid domain-containing protein n=1 Tax=Anisodus acutangulus TaxID=402998 RepID=A0A9Q1RD28_9SOLA|nr:hypothetical protein K7X08_000612 [Anisodus acutangulus]
MIFVLSRSNRFSFTGVSRILLQNHEQRWLALVKRMPINAPIQQVASLQTEPAVGQRYAGANALQSTSQQQQRNQKIHQLQLIALQVLQQQQQLISQQATKNNSTFSNNNIHSAGQVNNYRNPTQHNMRVEGSSLLGKVYNNGNTTQQGNPGEGFKSKGKYNGPHPELAAKLEKEILNTNPGVKWDDVAGLSEAKRILQEAVVLPLLMPEYFQGIRRPWRGVLITIFIDEIDSLCSARGSATEHETSRRVKSELLVQIDGLNNSKIWRRLEKRIYIPLPDFKSRKELIKINLKTIALAPGLDIDQVARRTEGYSGDDLTNICRDASLNGMRLKIAGKTTDEIKNISKAEILKIPVTMDDFLEALDKIQPTVSSGDIQRHEKWYYSEFRST